MTDAETNFLYLADALPKRYPLFYQEFNELLRMHNIPNGMLSGTRDIWAKDYMPIQCGAVDFLEFCYDPDYLKPKKLRLLRTDPAAVCDALGIRTRKTDIVIDGGNVIQGEDFIIMTDKILSENSRYNKNALIDKIEWLFQKQVIIIPKDPSDYTGHADGMVRLYRRRSVLINQYAEEDGVLAAKVKTALTCNGIDWIEIPYAPYSNSNVNDATGLYINFLQLRNIIFVPVFRLRQDTTAMDLFKQLFPASTIIPIMSNEIAKEGGVVNCISWNIYST